MSRSAVFLDRDGVLNAPVVRDGQTFAPDRFDGVRLLPGVEAACDALRDAGFLLIGATNQPDIARGKVDPAEVARINHWLTERLGLTAMEMCPHDDADDCPCRKPKPGMMTRAAGRFDIDLAASFMVGDRWRDIDAGRAAGCRTVFVDWDYDERRPTAPDLTVRSLADAVGWIKAQTLRSAS